MPLHCPRNADSDKALAARYRSDSSTGRRNATRRPAVDRVLRKSAHDSRRTVSHGAMLGNHGRGPEVGEHGPRFVEGSGRCAASAQQSAKDSLGIGTSLSLPNIVFGRVVEGLEQIQNGVAEIPQTFDEVHAHPRHSPRPVFGPAVLTAPPFAAASAVRQSPVLSTRPGCVSDTGCPSRRRPMTLTRTGIALSIKRSRCRFKDRQTLSGRTSGKPAPHLVRYPRGYGFQWRPTPGPPYSRPRVIAVGCVPTPSR